MCVLMFAILNHTNISDTISTKKNYRYENMQMNYDIHRYLYAVCVD